MHAMELNSADEGVQVLDENEPNVEDEPCERDEPKALRGKRKATAILSSIAGTRFVADGIHNI